MKPATLRVYADLLATLADDFLRSRYHTILEAERLAPKRVHRSPSYSVEIQPCPQALHERDAPSPWRYEEVAPMESKRTDRCAHALRVLVVEDHEDAAATLAMLLRLKGHNVEVAADGPSALRAVQASSPDVVLLDIGLPKMDGWLVAKQIREQSTWKRPFLVAISGYGMDADRHRSQEVGIDMHLVKPVDPETLAHVLERFESIVIDAGQVSSAAQEQAKQPKHDAADEKALPTCT